MSLRDSANTRLNSKHDKRAVEIISYCPDIGVWEGFKGLRNGLAAPQVGTGIPASDLMPEMSKPPPVSLQAKMLFPENFGDLDLYMKFEMASVRFFLFLLFRSHRYKRFEQVISNKA
jgi:hypothetical protein